MYISIIGYVKNKIVMGQLGIYFIMSKAQLIMFLFVHVGEQFRTRWECSNSNHLRYLC